MLIVLGVMPQSPYNQSIWSGFMRAFECLGHTVHVVDAAQLPNPDTLPVLPDFLYVVHGANTAPETVEKYRKSGTKTAIYLLDEPYEVDRTCLWSPYYDCVFSVDRATVPLHAVASRASHLPLAYDQTTFYPEGPSVVSEILVLGSPFRAREEFLTRVRDRWGDRTTWVGPGWRGFSPAGEHIEGFVTPEVCARFYRGAKIVINIHRDSWWSHFGDLNQRKIEATHLNPRFWEVAGCGSFQLCSYRSDLRTFAPKAATFRTVEEMERKIGYFLENDSVRQEQARYVHSKVRNHTYLERAKTVLAAISALRR
jgi:spore maturation protein CgeB